jgi:hypothetical protein
MPATEVLALTGEVNEITDIISRVKKLLKDIMFTPNKFFGNHQLFV